MTDDIILRAEGIRKSYGDLEILKGVDFSIGKGESCSIVGKSGSGKSTLLIKKTGGRFSMTVRIPIFSRKRMWWI